VISDLLRHGITVRQFLRTVLLLVLAVVICTTTTDPDLWGHVRFGLDILASHAIPSADTYSFASDRVWINHEWLSEVAFAVSYQLLGALGLNLVRVAAIVGVLTLAWRRASATGNSQIVVPVLAFAAIGIFLRVYPIRPQLFSILLFAVQLHLLTRYDTMRSARVLLWLPVVMCAWVNLHGGWIVGLGVLMVWTGMRVLLAPSDRRTALALMGITLATGAATLVNPYGPELWGFVRSTVGINRPLVSDWQPIYTLPPAFWAAWGVGVVGTLVVIRRAGRTIDPAYLAIVAMLGCAAFRVSRIDAFFALSVAFLLLPKLANLPDRKVERDAEIAPRPSRVLAGLAAALTVMTVVAVVQRLPSIDARYPMVPEAEAEAYIRTNRLSGRMLTWFDWGEYAIWHLSPDIQVSMDGRRETVYTDQQVASHMKFYFGGAADAHYPDEIGADYVWLPKTLRIVQELKVVGWHAAFEGPESVILVRADRHTVPTQIVSRQSSAVRYFPEP
jgi:hypothetical protein